MMHDLTLPEYKLWVQTNQLLQRIADSLERAYPPEAEVQLPPKPAGEEAFFRPSNADLVRLQREDRER